MKTVLKKNGWRFNWKIEFRYEDRQLYKLIVKGETNIQGLISLQPVENFIEMHLIERPRIIMVVQKDTGEWLEMW